MALIYIGGPWAERDLMPGRAAQFEAAGHIITHKWWDVDNLEEVERSPLLLSMQAEADWNGVDSAETMILFNTLKSEGKAVETGLALAWGIPIIAIGKRGDGNVFQYLPLFTWVDSITEALQQLEKDREVFG